MRVLLLLLLLVQDADTLIQKMMSEDVAERDDAFAQLVAMGPKVLPALKKRTNDGDRETRARVQQAISEIERRERVKSFRPPPVRVTMSIKDEPLDKAIARVMEAYGLKGELGDSDLAQKKISLELKDATPWAAIELIRTAGGVAPSSNLARLLRTPQEFTATAAEAPRAAVDLGEAGIIAALSATKKRATVSLRVLLPPGSLTLATCAEEVKVTAGGKKIDGDMSDTYLDESTTRRPGCLTCGTAWSATVTMEDLGEAAELDIEGTLVISWPRDMERHEIDIASLKDPVTKTVGGYEIKVLAVTERSSGRWKVDYEQHATTEECVDDIRWWMEDKEGAFVGEMAGDAIRSANTMTIRPVGTPSRVVIARVAGDEAVKYPFKLKGLRVPK